MKTPVNSELHDISHPVAKIEIQGRELLLEYNYRAYAMLEEATGKSVYELKDEILDGKITLTNRLLLLYCGLMRHQEDFKIETLQALPHIGNFLDECAASTFEAFFVPLLPPRI